MTALFKKRICSLAAPMVALTFSLTVSVAAELQVFDLTWNGPETSTVEECYGGDFFCHTFPIRGSLGVELGPDNPSLFNIESDILLPPQTPNFPAAISPDLWHNFNLLQGKYLQSENADEVSMVFQPVEIDGRLRAFEIFVSITDSGQFVALTGGIEQSAASPLEPDVWFSVSGKLTTNPVAEDLVDGADFLMLQRGYHANTASVVSGKARDNVFNESDFARWQSEFGTVRNPAVQSVPEPCTFALTLALVLSKLLYRQRRFASQT